MRIGIDATTWWNRRGFGRFTRRLLQAMFEQNFGHQFILFVDHPPTPEMVRENVRVVSVRTSATVTETAVAEGNRSIRDIWAFRRTVRRERPDVMYFPAVYSWLPVGPGIPTVVTFHDAIAEHFTSLVLPHRRGRVLWNVKTWLAKRSATRITTVSHAAAAEIERFLAIPRDQLAVIYEAAGHQFAPVTATSSKRALRDRLGIAPDRRYILYVGGIAPHKNLDGLVRAFALAAASPGMSDVDLVFAGDPAGDGFHSSHGSLLQVIAELPAISYRVKFTGFVPDEDLPTLYSDALTVAMPAFSEGFGLPAVEAIACGTPVIATGGGAVAEIVGEAGRFFDPNDVASMANVIIEIATEPQLVDYLRSRCLERARCFSWTSSALAMVKVLEHAKGRG